jgi:methylmalonyl-CoA epimerase
MLEERMNLKNIDHIGIAVSNLQESLSFWETSLGIELHGIEEVAEQNVRTAFLPVGGTEIELLEPTSADSSVAKFIEKRGEGLHHIAIRVDDIEAALAELKAKGIQLVDETPRNGAGGARMAFIHPKATHGVLLELCEREQK